MAGDYQQFTVIGRLTRDPERHDFQGGGGVTNFAIAFTGNSRFNQNTQRCEDEPCFLDCKAFIDAKTGRGPGDVVMRFTRKGTRLFITGRLVLEKWQDRNGGGTRQAIRLVVERLTLTDPAPQQGAGGHGGQHNENWDGGDGRQGHGGGSDDGWGDSQQGGYGGGNRNNSGGRGNQQGGGNYNQNNNTGDDDGIPF